MKIVVNRCFGGFGLSKEAYMAMGLDWDGFGHARDIPRNDPVLVDVVERLGHEADGDCSFLEVVEIPDGIAWEIEEYDGKEWVSEVHRTW